MDGKDSLQRREAAFEEDLSDVFEERAEEFGAHLRGMLFELWERATQRPASEDELLKSVKELEGKKAEIGALVAEEFKKQLPHVATQFEKKIESVMERHFPAHLTAELEDPKNEPMLCRRLEELLKFEMPFETYNEGWRLRISSRSSENGTFIPPELPKYEPDDEYQRALLDRLDRDDNYRPVMMNRSTGRQGILEGEYSLIMAQDVEVHLAPTDGGCVWLFPNPRPDGGSSLSVHVNNVQAPAGNYTKQLNRTATRVIAIEFLLAPPPDAIVTARYSTAILTNP